MDKASVYHKSLLALATVGPVGKMPVAPGTWGSAAAVLLAPFLLLSVTVPYRLLILAVVFVIGSLAATRAEEHYGCKDPGAVVIDEVLGQWLTFAFFPVVPLWQIIAGFFLFRAFDILKPPPVKQAEDGFPSGWGVMADDAVAGIYAGLVLFILRLIFV